MMVKLGRSLVACALASALFWRSPSAAQPAPPAPASEERASLEKCLSVMPEGVQVAIALLRGEEMRFLGAARTSGGVKFIDNRDAVFQIGSITKAFTATLFAQQVAAGALALDDAVASRLPFPLGTSGRGGVEMTLVQLASHTSGIGDHQPPGLTRHAWLHLHPDEPWRDYDRVKFEAYLRKDLSLTATPGARYFYSNVGMSLLGLVVSLRTGKPYETLLREGIFRPLGMSSSTTDATLVRDRVIPGLKVNGKPFPNQDMGALAPAGGIYSSAADLARFARWQVERTDPAVVLSQKPVFTISEGEQVALGWHVYDWVGGWRTINHNGAIGGYTGTLNIDTQNRRAALVLSNVMNEGACGEAVRALGRALLKQVEAVQGPAKVPAKG